jgi:Leucine-rich repeat (LRR) protein
MANPDVTDQSLRFLKGMTRLRELDLNDTAITDTGLDVLTSLSGLEILRLRNTRISDAGFQNRLALMESLRQLDLRGTAITSESIAAWRQSKPGRRAMK